MEVAEVVAVLSFTVLGTPALEEDADIIIIVIGRLLSWVGFTHPVLSITLTLY